MFKEQMLSENSENMSEELNKKIENKLKTFLSTGGIGKAQKEETGIKIHLPNNPVDSPVLYDFPTFLTISNKDMFELPINKDLVLNYISDANHELFYMEDNLSFFFEKEESLLFDGFKFYKNGHGIINFKLSPDIKVGDNIFFKLYIKGYDDDENLSSSITIKIVDKEVEGDSPDEKTKQPPKITPIPVFKNSNEYDEFFSEDPDLPCVLKDSDESIEIFINMENKSLRKLQENITKNSVENHSIKLLNDEYIKQIAFYSLIIHISEEKKNEVERMDENKINEELKRVAILISGMINDNLSVYITESEINNGTENID